MLLLGIGSANPPVLSYRYDENGNGLWSISEFNTYEANFKSEATFGMVDRSRGGAISKSEFVVFYRASSTFEKYATKETGTITQDSWKKYANDYGINCTVSFVDTSRNGAISRLEFYASLYTAACQPSAKARFAQIDANSDGVWSPEEYKAYSTKFAGCSNPTDTPCPFAVANRKKNGKMTLEEFSYATDSYTQFSEFDEDGDLKLTEDQFKAYIAKYPGTRRQTGSDFAKIDKDKSGYCEYCNEVLKKPEPEPERCDINCKIGLGVGIPAGLLLLGSSVWLLWKWVSKPPVMPAAKDIETKFAKDIEAKSAELVFTPPTRPTTTVLPAMPAPYIIAPVPMAVMPPPLPPPVATHLPVVAAASPPMATKTTLKRMSAWINTAVPKWELKEYTAPVTEIDYAGTYNEAMGSPVTNGYIASSPVPNGYIASSPVPVPTSQVPHRYIASSPVPVPTSQVPHGYIVSSPVPMSTSVSGQNTSGAFGAAAPAATTGAAFGAFGQNTGGAVRVAAGGGFGAGGAFGAFTAHAQHSNTIASSPVPVSTSVRTSTAHAKHANTLRI